MRSVAPRIGAVVLLCAVAAPLRAADINDTADLFPAGTLAYLEFRQPAQLSREVAALLKGSAFEDMPKALAKVRDKRADNNVFFFNDLIIGYLSMFASPEMVAEFGRLRGGAVALTGFNSNSEPEIVGILLSGSSNGPTFIMRTALTVDPWMRRIDECEGIGLYREKRQEFRKKEAVAPDFSGPTYALLPDGLIIGSSTDGVKEMIRRLKGRTSDPSLASVSAFRSAAALRDKPGLFGYADLAELNTRLEEAMKTADPLASYQWKYLQTLLNPKAGKQATVSLTLSNGSLELNARVELDAKETSPLVALLPDGKTNAELLHYVPKDSSIALTFNLADGEKRWAQALALVDALDKLGGKRRGPTPSKQVEETESALKLKFGKDIFAKLTGAAVVLDLLALETSPNPARIAVLSTTDADAAKALEEDVLPKLAGLLPKGSKEPKQETIQGHRITAIQDADLFFGRHGKILVIGQSSQAVADALTAGAKKAGLLGETRTSTALKEAPDASLVGVLSLGSLLAFMTPLEAETRLLVAPAPVPPGAPKAPPQSKRIHPVRAKLTKELIRVCESAPPAVLTVERKPEHVTMMLRQANLRMISAKLVNGIVDATLERMFNPGGEAGGGAEAVPPPPAKK
jgi:hypothetical protein